MPEEGKVFMQLGLYGFVQDSLGCQATKSEFLTPRTPGVEFMLFNHNMIEKITETAPKIYLG